MASIWHIGLAVPGLEGKKELSDVFGLSWRPTRVRTLTLVDAYGRPYDWNAMSPSPSNAFARSMIRVLSESALSRRELSVL